MDRLCVREAGGRLHCRWWCADAEQWAMVLSDFKARFRTHGQACYSPRTGWSLPISAGAHLAQWAERWFDDSEVEWTREEPADGPGRQRRERSGRKKRTGGPPASVVEAHAQLFLLPGAPPGLVEQAYRWWAKELHPDTGHGDHGRMAQINAAVAVIRKRTHKSSA